MNTTTTAAAAGRASLLIALSACAFGSIAILTTFALGTGAPLLSVLTWRYLFAAIVLLAISVGRGLRPDGTGLRVMVAGGLAQATIVANTLFGAACGSSVAAAATFGKIAVPEMLRYGYAKSLATACVAAAGTLAIMIPPSIAMVLYGLITDTSIAKLLVAGIIPGVFSAAVYMATIHVWAKRYPQDAPPFTEPWSWKENFRALKGVVAILIICVIVLGGIYSGITTATEAGALGSFAALVLTVVMRRLSWTDFKIALKDSVKTTVMIQVILLSAFIFGYFMAVTLLPQKLASWLTGLPIPGLAMIVLIMLVYIVLGAFMDMLSVMFITVPIIFPTIVALGFNPIWFGILMVQVIEMGLITPPFGINLFVIKGTVPQIPFKEVIAGIWPFVIAQTVTLGFLIAFPQIALYLPDRMLGP